MNSPEREAELRAALRAELGALLIRAGLELNPSRSKQRALTAISQGRAYLNHSD